MKLYAYTIAVLCLFCLSQTVFCQNTKKNRKTERPIGCADCGFPIKGIPIYLPKPEYPKAASAVNVSGIVGVLVTINKQGSVIKAEAVTGHLLLQAAAIKAALQAIFKPIIILGKPAQVSGIINYNFASKDSIQIEVSEQTDKSKANEDKLNLPIVNGRASYLPKPVYPQKAAAFCVGGKVEVEVLIGEKGTVIEAKAISGDELLQDSAVEAAKKAKFAPLLINTPAVKTRGIIVYNFDSFVKCFDLAKVVNKNALSIPKPKVVNLNGSKYLQIKDEQNVTVRIIIDDSGKVIYAKAVSGHSMLRGACETSARNAKFAPTLINTRPFRIKALLIYKFKPDGTIEF